jgi:hypothetical protein
MASLLAMEALAASGGFALGFNSASGSSSRVLVGAFGALAGFVAAYIVALVWLVVQRSRRG